MQPSSTAKKGRSRGNTESDPSKAVFASSIARYVVKNGRKTVPPEKALLECGLLPADENELAEVERLRLK